MRLQRKILIVIGLLLITVALAYLDVAPKVTANIARPDLAGIEKLHQQDVAATLAGDPKALADLWTDDAVRLEPDGPAEVSRALIKGNDEKQKASHPETRILTYAPEIKDVKVVDGWAFEWGYFTSSYRESAASPVKSFRGKLLRVMQKQRDGSWKFSRVMWNLAE
jgi:ketosteroid isomerase-like protein